MTAPATPDPAAVADLVVTGRAPDRALTEPEQRAVAHRARELGWTPGTTARVLGCRAHDVKLLLRKGKR